MAKYFLMVLKVKLFINEINIPILTTIKKKNKLVPLFMNLLMDIIEENELIKQYSLTI